MLTRINGMARWMGLAVSRFSEATYDAYVSHASRLALRVGIIGKVNPDLHRLIGSELSMGYSKRQVGPESDRGSGIRIAARLGECG